MHLVQSRFATLKEARPRELSFDDLAKNDDPTRINEQLVVTVDAQLFYGLLDALPYLVNYPYECTEQTLNRFLSTGILTSLYDKYPPVGAHGQGAEQARDGLRDVRRRRPEPQDGPRGDALARRRRRAARTPAMGLEKVLDPRVAKAQRETSLAKLLKAQTSLGAFPWWPGGPPSPYMTLYIVHGFSKARRVRRRRAQGRGGQRAFAYLHRHYLDEIVSQLMAHDTAGSS